MQNLKKPFLPHFLQNHLGFIQFFFMYSVNYRKRYTAQSLYIFLMYYYVLINVYSAYSHCKNTALLLKI